MGLEVKDEGFLLVVCFHLYQKSSECNYHQTNLSVFCEGELSPNTLLPGQRI